MNDWWNDMPDDEPGECETAQSDPEPEDYYIGDMEPPMAPKLCPHGQEWAECNACMIAGDLAFDAARESRF